MACDDCKFAWAAGIIDGEGTVTIYQHHPRPQHPHGATQPLVAVETTAQEIAERFKLMFGGIIYHIPQRTGRKLEAWRWQVTGVKVTPVLERILPWLTVKRAHAQLLIDFWKECGLKHGGHKKRFMSEANFQRRLQYVAQIREMQIKGPEAVN